MKLQTLKSPKFKPIEKNVVKDMSVITGGRWMSFSHGTSGCSWDRAQETGTLGTATGDWGPREWVKWPCAPPYLNTNISIEPTSIEITVNNETNPNNPKRKYKF